MTHTWNAPYGRSPEAILREAREARDRAVADLLAGAAAGLGRIATAVWRGLVLAGGIMVSTIATARRRRTAIRELQALDDRMLKDIGISRGDIPLLVGQQLSAKLTASAAADHECEITAFPDRQTTAQRPDDSLRPAA